MRGERSLKRRRDLQPGDELVDDRDGGAGAGSAVR
jgi:hypothetical protein